MNPDPVIEVCQLPDADATRALGHRLAEQLRQKGTSAGGPEPYQVLLLQGGLGAGKTCLVQGLAEGLGITEPITSPTFALAHHYSGELGCERQTALVHLDLYRLEHPASADELFAQEEEEARSLGAVLAVEWPERLSLLPESCWRVELEIMGEERLARIHGVGISRPQQAPAAPEGPR